MYAFMNVYKYDNDNVHKKILIISNKWRLQNNEIAFCRKGIFGFFSHKDDTFLFKFKTMETMIRCTSKKTFLKSQYLYKYVQYIMVIWLFNALST